MKLTVDLSILLNAVEKMRAGNISFALTGEVTPIEPIDAQLGAGLEVDLADVEFNTGLASYKGRQVLLYIKDHGIRVGRALEDGSDGNKFHIADCKTLGEMKKKGRFDRYVVTNDLSGMFSIAGEDKDTRQHIDGKTELNVCKLCLQHLNYQGYQNKSKAVIFKTFNLADFFDTYSSFFKIEPSGIADSANVGYSNDWSEISKTLKKKKLYICQQCTLDLSLQQRLLHVHHINGVKNDNNQSNLKVLCADCHRKQPDHAHMFIKHLDSKLINQLRREQGIVANTNWTEIYNLVDPAMLGVVNLLEKYQVPLPGVAEEVQDKNQAVVTELELAWPQRRIGIAIDKESAKLATRQGWKVWSMRHALVHINELAASLR